jgi:hypothetical protein
VAVLELEIETVAVATVPVPIVVVFPPYTMQMTVKPDVQLMLLPAAVTDGSATTVTALTSELKFMVHCKLAGEAPPEGVEEIVSATLEPGGVVPEPIPTATC